jgi:hypothetical protein
VGKTEAQGPRFFARGEARACTGRTGWKACVTNGLRELERFGPNIYVIVRDYPSRAWGKNCVPKQELGTSQTYKSRWFIYVFSNIFYRRLNTLSKKVSFFAFFIAFDVTDTAVLHASPSSVEM